jgi:hypothetical protein
MFYKLPTKSTIAKDLLAFAKQTDKWVSYYNFDAVQVPFDLVYTDPTLQNIGAKHAMAAGVLRLKPFTTYDWHIDTQRGVSINMLLNDAPSHCLFSTNKSETWNEFVELAYEPNNYYLFNNQVPHMVLNFDTPRYLMSVEFEEDKNELSFEMLLKELR